MSATYIEESSWYFATLALRSHRVDLMAKFNRILGVPSYEVARMQHDFLEGKMEPEETVAFAKVCLALIEAASKVGR